MFPPVYLTCVHIYIFNSALLAKEHQETKEILQNVSNNRLSLKINDLFALYVIFLKDIVFVFFLSDSTSSH